MNRECLKLTTWFGERDRDGRELIADALLGIHERHGLEASVLLRGIEGFGLKHRLRTDRLLTLSEDLPVVSVAVDRRDRIEAALEETAALRHHGLITVERARLLAGGDDVVPPPGPRSVESRLTLYLRRRQRIGGRPAFMAICDLLREHGVQGATALVGVDGTLGGKRVRARFFDRNADVPIMLVAVGSDARLAGALDALDGLSERPPATVERVRILKRDGVPSADPDPVAPAPAGHDPRVESWRKLTVYTGEAALHDGRPIHRQIVRRLRAAGASGATALRGVWGYHGDHRPHGDRPLQLRRHVPVVTSIVDSAGRMADWLGIVDELTAETGLVTSEPVPVISASAETRPRGPLRLPPDQPSPWGDT